MAFKVLITERANQDLAAIVEFVAKDNRTAAERLGNRLIDAVKLLADFPSMGRIVPERGSPHIREVVQGSYRIIYRLKENVGSLKYYDFGTPPAARRRRNARLASIFAFA